MAWTLPVTRASLFTITSSIWNNEHVNNLLEASTIYSWVVGWGSASNPQPAIGNGTLLGDYIKLGKLVTFRITLVAGSTTTFGTGVWTLTLPLTADGSSGNMVLSVQDVGTAFYTGAARLVSTTSIQLITHGAASFVSQGTPFTWVGASADNLVITGQYFSASV